MQRNVRRRVEEAQPQALQVQPLAQIEQGADEQAGGGAGGAAGVVSDDDDSDVQEEDLIDEPPPSQSLQASGSDRPAAAGVAAGSDRPAAEDLAARGKIFMLSYLLCVYLLF